MFLEELEPCVDCCPVREDGETLLAYKDRLLDYNEQEIRQAICMMELIDVCELPLYLTKLLQRQYCLNRELIKLVNE